MPAGRLTGWNLSPDGRQAVIEARGDIWTVGVDGGSHAT
jgi:hypothetical protein